jgi:Concanavalin A-like lectin/glucanases superfamily
MRTFVLIAFGLLGCGGDDSPVHHAPDAPRGGCASAAAFWQFDEGSGTTAADSSGQDHTLQLTSPTWVSGHDGGALQFDGFSTSGITPYTASLRADRAIAMTAWVKPTGGNFGGIIAAGQPGVVVEDWGFYDMSAEAGALFNYPALGNNATYSSGLGLAAGTWSFIAVALDVDANTLAFYKDGALVTSVPSPVTTSLLQRDQPIYVGVDADAPMYYAGALDSLAIWTRALSASDVAQIYAGTCAP